MYRFPNLKNPKEASFLTLHNLMLDFILPDISVLCGNKNWKIQSTHASIFTNKMKYFMADL